jgi:tRNA U34 5-methylaminomethyl-2-thiouridine-forming methyltransferase MnmC
VGKWSLSKSFDDDLHSLTLSDDGSYTAYSKEYDEHYHSTKDGALKESLKKHVIPAFSVIDRDEVYILDICYGLGFNTLATLLYVKENFPHKKLYIYSPELDKSLVKSLEFFTYPEEFGEFKEIILALSRDGFYEEENLYIELFLGDARAYIKKFDAKFDIIYQDAFSPSTNPILWTEEYFADIKNAMKCDAVLTTYSIALKTRLALYKNGFVLHLNKGEGFRVATIAAFKELDMFEVVDMEHKIACNKNIEALQDRDI